MSEAAGPSNNALGKRKEPPVPILPPPPKRVRTEPPIRAPVGFICCIFTDIVGSTAMWEFSELMAANAIAMHDRILRRELQRHGGYEVKNLGDGFFVTFADPRIALEFCMASQLALRWANWSTEILARQARIDLAREDDPRLTFRGLTARMGIHHGKMFSETIDPTTGRLDYHGKVGCVASRVHNVGDGDEIVVSDNYICALYANLSGRVGREEDLDNDHRQRILSHVVPTSQFVLSSKGDREFKGVTKTEHITSIALN